jgi:putative acetyltransferase
MNIVNDDLSHPAVKALLAEHMRGMVRHCPPGSIHSLDLDGLRSPDVSFWTAWFDQELLGCAALKELDARHGEIKSMRTARKHLGKGVAAELLRHIMTVAHDRGYGRLSLETGSGPAFEPAHALYQKFGFEFCGPFHEYGPDPSSRFMTRRLS